MKAIAKKQHNPYAEQYILRTRNSKGIEVIYMRAYVREFIRALKENSCLAFLSDQDARKHGEFVDFFGKPASTYKGPAVLHLRTNAPIIPCYSYRDKNNIHHCVFEPSLEFDLSNNYDENIRLITRALNERIENWIKKYPEQYFWFHKRWKSSPSQDIENS